MDTNKNWTFYIASHQKSATLAAEVEQTLRADGHKPCSICDNPDIIVVLGLGKMIQLFPGHARDAMGWLRAIVDHLEFGGSAIAFCPKHLKNSHLGLLNVERLALDHGARKLVISFGDTDELREKLSKLPEAFDIWDMDEENEGE